MDYEFVSVHCDHQRDKPAALSGVRMRGEKMYEIVIIEEIGLRIMCRVARSD